MSRFLNRSVERTATLANSEGDYFFDLANLPAGNSPLGGWHAVPPPEERAEGSQACEPAVHADLRDRDIAVAQHLRRALQPPAHEILVRPLAKCLAKQAVKVIGRKARRTRDLFQ